MSALLAKAIATGREAIDIRITRSGRWRMHLVRPNGHGGAAEADTHAAAFRLIKPVRDQLDNPGPDVRGPAADRPRAMRGEGP